MEYTGERMIPEINKGEEIWAEHYARYIFARQFVRGKKVLDVACGSGYGSFYLVEKGAKNIGFQEAGVYAYCSRENNFLINYFKADA